MFNLFIKWIIVHLFFYVTTEKMEELLALKDRRGHWTLDCSFFNFLKREREKTAVRTPNGVLGAMRSIVHLFSKIEYYKRKYLR